ncbi:MAG: NERD domain-containing protein [Kineosporiaceae bacterium]|nr:NERD domain-containing protein [Aeromicrobium sp.]
MPVGTSAVYDRDTKSVTCMACLAETIPSAPQTTGPDFPESFDDAKSALPELGPEQSEAFAGVAGASAQHEYERRKNKRETRIRDAHPRMGGLILALSDDPQSTKAWATGAQGEKRLGRQLDGLIGDGVHVLHDRRIPPTKANIDHIVVCPSGVFVIDAKKYQGQRPSLRIEGGWIRARTETLMVGSRNRTNLVDGVHQQVARVQAALDAKGLSAVPVGGMLCFVEADWPLIGGDFTIAGLNVLWPKKVASHIIKPGAVDIDTVKRVYQALASSFPPA